MRKDFGWTGSWARGSGGDENVRKDKCFLSVRSVMGSRDQCLTVFGGP